MAEAKEYIIGLNKVFRAPRTKRARRAINFIKKFMKKNLRAEEEKVLISNKVNEFIWANGREHIPRKIKVKALKEADIVRVFLVDEEIPKEEKKAKKEEKEKKAVKEEKKSEAEIKKEKEKEEEQKKKLEEKRIAEKVAEKAAIKRG